MPACCNMITAPSHLSDTSSATEATACLRRCSFPLAAKASSGMRTPFKVRWQSPEPCAFTKRTREASGFPHPIRAGKTHRAKVMAARFICDNLIWPTSAFRPAPTSLHHPSNRWGHDGAFHGFSVRVQRRSELPAITDHLAAHNVEDRNTTRNKDIASGDLSALVNQ